MSDPNPRQVPPPPVPPPPVPPPPPIQPPPEEPERKSASPLIWILLLIALVAFGWYFFNQRGAVSPPQEPAAPPAVDIGSSGEAAAEREREAAAQREARDRESAAAPPATAVADRDPAPLTRVEPEYPVTAARAREEGVVLVSASIDARGNPVDVTVVRRSGSRELDRAAVDAVRQWTFEPAIRDGRPSPSQVEVPVEFTLSRQ